MSQLTESPKPWCERWWTEQYAEDVPDWAAELARQRALLVAPDSPINQPGYSETDNETGEGVLVPAGLYDEMYQAWLWRAEHEQNGQYVP
jgi:hypothetical protein